MLSIVWASLRTQLVKNPPPTPLFWPGEFHGHSPWGCKELETTEQLSLFHCHFSLSLFTISPSENITTFMTDIHRDA